LERHRSAPQTLDAPAIEDVKFGDGTARTINTECRFASNPADEAKDDGYTPDRLISTTLLSAIDEFAK
jgi:hypothetical protein